jgi:hypothetical protein
MSIACKFIVNECKRNWCKSSILADVHHDVSVHGVMLEDDV